MICCGQSNIPKVYTNINWHNWQKSPKEKDGKGLTRGFSHEHAGGGRLPIPGLLKSSSHTGVIVLQTQTTHNWGEDLWNLPYICIVSSPQHMGNRMIPVIPCEGFFGKIVLGRSLSVTVIPSPLREKSGRARVIRCNKREFLHYSTTFWRIHSKKNPEN